MRRAPANPAQTGFILAYVLYGIALIALVSAAYAQMRNTDDQSQNIEETVNTLIAQVEVLKTKIFLCGAIYPDGDHGQFPARRAYPAPATSANRDVITSVVCPGAPAGANSLANMSDGQAIPVPPPDFKPWEYQHTETAGVLLHLMPRLAGGASQVRTRLLRQLGTSAAESGDDIAILVLK